MNFNDELYRRIREERKKIGLPICNLSEEIKDHKMIGKKFFANDENKTFYVKSVHRQFYSGFFIMYMFIDDEGSSRPSYMENINSISEIIKESVIENKSIFSLKDI